VTFLFHFYDNPCLEPLDAVTAAHNPARRMINFGNIQQAGVLPYEIRKGKLRVLLITSTGTRRWIIPKGYVEPKLTARESAEFEAYEEAGVSGRLAATSIGAYTYVKRDEKGGGRFRVKVYPMEVTRILDDYPEAAQRKRKWMKVDDAIKAVEEPGLKTILRTFARRHAAKTGAEKK